MGHAPKIQAPTVVTPPPAAAPATMASSAVAQAAAKQKSKGAAPIMDPDASKALETPTTANSTLLGQ